jgi:hypothetical protein
MAIRTPAPRPLLEKPNGATALRVLRGTLFLLVLVLVFEGIARKVNFKGTSTPIFFLKDFIILLLGVQVLRLRRSRAIQWLWITYLLECALFLPLILCTAWQDPILAVFGAKEYLLYPVVAIATFLALESSTMLQIIWFFRWISLLVIPTTLLALYQLHQPADSWINLSVGGDSLEGFSANGVLRVSSTFPFVAQYCAFLNAQVFITAIALSRFRDLGVFGRALYLFIVPMLILGCYMTGSRGAVLTDLVVIAIAATLSVLKFRARSTLRVVVIVVFLLIALAAAHFVEPDAFQVYSTRENGQLLGASTEIRDRVYKDMFSWTSDISSTPFFGYGLGIMSNGSESLSKYASMIRGNSWTETDFASTLFEGGIYLVMIWYPFRYFIIGQCIWRFLRTDNDNLSVPMGFAVGVVTVVGFVETLGIQPPIAIWWWFAVGAAVLLWWKSEHPDPVEGEKKEDPPDFGPPKVQKIRGQSAYAARLHGNGS